MERIHRLRLKTDFDTLFRTGRRITSPLFRIVAARNHTGALRAAFVTPRTVDKRATVRNRIRRRAREWVRRNSELLSSSLDIAFLFTRAAVKSPRRAFYDELTKNIDILLRKTR